MKAKCKKCNKIIEQKDIADIKQIKFKSKKNYIDINYQIICKSCKENPN